MKLNDSKIQDGGGCSPATNGSLTRDEPNIESRNAFESKNGSSSNDSHHEYESVSPIDTIPFNIEGIQTVVKNSHETTTKTNFENGFSSHNLLLAELHRYKEENSQLRAALKEASRVNQQWRNYHDQRQGYVQKLLSSLQDLQQSTSLTQASGRSSVELQRLRETFCKQQKEHNEHIQLLQLQVRAHRDDWEAERSEKKAAEIGRIQAEAQLQIVQRQLEEATAMLAELDGRLKLCKCFAGTNGDTTNNSERRGPPSFHNQNGNLSSAENVPRLSPSFSSTNSICSGTSRSSSVSKDLSSSSSPTITKNVQSLSPYGVNTENSRTSSPSMRISAAKSSTLKSTENQHPQERTGAENHSSTLPSSQGHQQEEMTSSSLKTHQGVPDSGPCGKSKGNGKGKGEPLSENSLHYYESKGARPKALGKVNDEEERQAKHRARSILASALPMSPSSSKPTSPVTVSAGKGTNIPKGYVPITSTVLTPVKFRPPFTSNKKSEPDQSHEVHSKRNHQSETPNSVFNKIVETSKSNRATNGNHEAHHYSKTNETDSGKNANSQQASDELFRNKSNISPKCKLSSSKKSSENLAVCSTNDQTEYKQCSSIQINGLTCQSSGTNDHNCATAKNHPNEVKKTKSSKDEIIATKDSLDIKTATKMRQNTKSLIVTNNQQEKVNTNYASITVMPGPSSALYSHTQTTSTTSSRSSSPGISLTTFALNANGQGVPGAIFFALGSEPKSPKSPQPSNVSFLSSVTSNESHEEVNSSKNNPTTCKEPPESGTNERIVNSTWVQLMDKENNSTRSPSRTPWRTARAVPSHKLNSVRKTHPDDTSSNGLPPTVADGIRQTENFHPNYNSMVGNKMSCNGNNHLKPHLNYETRYQTSFSPPPTYVSCSRTSPSISLTPTPSYSQNDFRNASSPTICIIPHSTHSQPYAEADLRTMASRNISSAILSYECGSKGCTNLQGRKQIIETQTTNAFYDQYPLKPHTSYEPSSGHCLICPSCQKLFPSENTPKYAQHLQVCGGPKYADM